MICFLVQERGHLVGKTGSLASRGYSGNFSFRQKPDAATALSKGRGNHWLVGGQLSHTGLRGCLSLE